MDGNQSYSNYSGMVDDYSEYDEKELVYLCETEYRDSASSATAACYAIIFCLSLAGNLVVLCALVRFEDLKKVTNLFVLNLAVLDLVFAVSLPFWITDHLYSWVFGNALCKLVSGLYFISIYSSLMFLVAMTVERYIVIVHMALTQHQKHLLGSRVVCTMIWVISISASVREMVLSRILPDQYTCDIRDQNSQEVYINYCLHICFLFILPLTVIVFCYSRILKTVLSSRTKNRHRTVALIFVIVLTFFVCRAPYNVMILFMLRIDERDCDTQKRLYVAFVIVRILAYSHCCLNPLLYTLGEKCRAHIRRLFCSLPPQQRYNSVSYHVAHGLNVTDKSVAINGKASVK
ncbi:chemokine XC receptor 1-like [Brienomyrus brachyistius]|uniref:chemokine XC receptor 1-like n=1 Tax=Brienomyrus brachyistius TaxID=42636 RepID=UPI0020B18991|nr:chemokine XC receptor 1-like [Brienomyrus brachyistius]